MNRTSARLQIGLLAAAVLLTSAHVGSPDVYFEGTAGPYGVRVIVRTPGVVPGQADITVRVTSGGPVTTVALIAAFFNTGLKGAPPPDTSRMVSPGLYSSQLWFMRSGPYSLHVFLHGPAGKGTVIVPVVAVATRRLDFQRPVAIGLIGLGLFLLVGAITIIRAAVSESELPAGQAPNALDKTYGWVAAGTSAVLLALAVWGGRAWWNNEDAAYRRIMYRPWKAEATVVQARDVTLFTFRVTDSIWRVPGRALLMPDHGKLMHLFLVKAPGSDAFAHLHPTATDSTSFVTALPALPAGHYRAYADIVLETGATRTLTTELDIPAPVAGPRWAPSDPDDAVWMAAPSAASDTLVPLGDGLTMSWTRPSTLARNADLDLQFTVRDAKGNTVTLDPYMGMAAHAVVARDDGGVFIHLHPMGTISLAAQQALELRQDTDTTLGSVARRVAAASTAHPMTMSTAGTFSFPYAFPEPGAYHVWVQVRHGAKILTGAFPVQVR